MASRAPKPTANAGGPYSGTSGVGLRVTGSGTSSAPIVNYRWTWGDGTLSTSTSSPETTHTYAVAGIYKLQLVVTNSLGASSKSASTRVTISNGNQSPTVTIIAPITGDTFIAPADITLSATATDIDGTIVSVKFYQNNTLLTTITAPLYEYQWISVPVGIYTIKAVAEDNGGLTASVESVITVTDLPTAPTVSITSPLDGATFTAPASFTTTAVASDAVGVTQVDFYLDGVLHIIDTTSPYTATISALAGGTHTLYAIATNTSNLTTTSSTITITVTPAAPVCTITAPANGTVYDAPADITVSATASSAGGTITQVEFFKNAVSAGVDTTSPYSVLLSAQPIGTYTLTATATNNSAATGTSAPVVVTVQAPPAAPTVDLQTTSTSITVGQSITLSWTSTGATSAAATGGWSGSKATAGSEIITPPAAGSYTYTLTVTGAGGQASDFVTVTVNLPPAPVLTFNGTPLTVVLGESVTLTWSSTGGTSATASGAWSGTKGLSGSQSVTPAVVGTVVYTLTITGAGGTDQESVSVTVTPTPPSPPTVDLQTSTINITLGQSVNLSWTSTNGTSAAASGSWSGSKALSGSEVVTPTAVGTFVYTLTVTGTGGTASDSVTITVTSSGGGTTIATYTLTPGPVTFGMALAQGTTPTGLQIGSLSTQTDVKTRWSDGTIRFAVVSADVVTAGSYAITAGPVSGSAYTPTWPTVTVTLVIAGVTWTATLGSFSGTDSWLSGQVCREARVVAVPMNGITPHTLLQVVFDIRSYASGGHRIDFTVQNVRDTSSMDKVTYTSVALNVNSVAVWTHSTLTSYSFTRWRKVYETFTASQVTPDFTPAFAAGVLPKILSTVGAKTYDLTQPNYDVMGGRPSGGYPAFAFGEMNPDMSSGGGREEIGALCWWEARYISTKTQNLRNTVIRNADLTGCWSNQLAKSDGTTMIKLGDSGYSATNWWWDSRASVGNRPLAPLVAATNFRGAREGLSADTDTGLAGVASRYDAQHVPAPMFVAYLITGDRYYVDQAKFWAVSAIMHKFAGWINTDAVNFPGWKRGRNGATGNERILDDDGMSREFAWPLRLVGMATWMVPDSDSDKTYLSTTIQNNLNHAGEYLDIWVTRGAGGTIGMIGGAESTSGWSTTKSGVETGRYTSTWRMSYTAYSLDWCTRQGLWTVGTSVTTLINRIINMHIRMNIQNTQFLAGKSGLSYPYYPVIGIVSSGVITQWLNTFAELKSYNETYPFSDNCTQGACFNWNPNEPATGYYDTEHWMTLQIGIRRGLTDAQNASTRLTQVAGVTNDVNNRAGFAITF